VSVFQPPPTYADLIIKDAVSGTIAFNPIWLNWFVELTKFTQGGGAGTVYTVNGQTGDVIITADSIGALPISGGTMEGAIYFNMGGGTGYIAIVNTIEGPVFTFHSDEQLTLSADRINFEAPVLTTNLPGALVGTSFIITGIDAVTGAALIGIYDPALVITNVASSTTMTLTYSTYRVTGAGGVTMTLPEATLLLKGREWTVSNDSAGKVTVSVNLAGDDRIVLPPPETQKFELTLKGASATFRCVDFNVWILV